MIHNDVRDEEASLRLAMVGSQVSAGVATEWLRLYYLSSEGADSRQFECSTIAIAITPMKVLGRHLPVYLQIRK